MSHARLVASIILVVVIGTAVGYALLVSPVGTKPTTSPSQAASSTSTSQTASLLNSNGLEFTMSLNSSTLERGSNLTVSLNLYNTLGRINNVSGADDWRLTNESESGPSMNCAQNDPFRTEVLAGYYDLGNFSKGAPLVFTVFQPPLGFNQCLLYIIAANNTAPPLFYTYSTNNYIFSPTSDRAQWIATGFQTANQEAIMSETALLKPSLFSNSSGVFTVVSGDEWGDLVIQHFQAGSASSQSTSTSQGATETACMVTITTTFVNVTTTQTATEGIACATSSAGISVSGLSLCAANCVYPSPYLSGQLNINGPTPVTIDVYVNGTFDGSTVLNPTTLPPGCFLNGTQTTCSTGSVATASTLSTFADMYKGSIPNAFIPAVVGDRYVVTFVATFHDGSSAIASAVVVATA